MLNLFRTVLVMSFVGSVVSLILFVLRRPIRKLVGERWSAALFYGAFLIFLVPLSINLSVKEPQITQSVLYIANTMQPSGIYAEGNDVTEIPNSSEESAGNYDNRDTLYHALSKIYLTVALFLLALRIASYYVSLRKTLRQSMLLKIYRGIKVYSSQAVFVPMATGIIKRRIFIPCSIENSPGTECIMLHEYTHFIHGDVFGKWLAMIGKCVHWFNPIVYILSNIAGQECEYSCDASVSQEMSETEKKEYMNTILSMISKCSSRLSLTTYMADSKTEIKNRFAIISQSRKKGMLKNTFSMLTAILLIVVLFASSALAAGRYHEDGVLYLTLSYWDNSISEADYTKMRAPDKRREGLSIQNTDVSLNLNAISGDEVADILINTESDTKNIHINYDAPIGGEQSNEFLENEVQDIANHTVNSLSQDVFSDEYDKERYPGDMRGILYFDNWSYEKTIDDLQKCGYTQTSSDEKNLETSYVTGTLSYETGNVARITNVKSDENGNIEFYMDSEYDQYVEIGFEYEGKQISGSGFVQRQENIYYFGGFDPDKSYDITIESSSGDTWKTTSKYIVY